PKFQQDGLRWIGKVGGSGSGRSDSTCTSPTQTRYDFRYNIIENTATCTNELTKKMYQAPVSTTTASIATGQMTKLTSVSYGRNKFDVWGSLFRAPSITLPVGKKALSGFYETSIQVDVSSLPAGNYQCRIRNVHGAFGSNTNNIVPGVNKIFNLALSTNGWATGYFGVTIDTACSIISPDNIIIEHGSIPTGKEHLAKKEFRVTCNKDSSFTVSLRSDGVASDGVLVNIGNSGSQSLLSISDGTGKSGRTIDANVISNIPYTFRLLSKLNPKGSGSQKGIAIAQISYN
ncbi:hypothetical protein KNZ44_005187, partial [Escherichia coli]|nr:hypothetical protein [Escherichia coli]